jgi:hypothetical protein
VAAMSIGRYRREHDKQREVAALMDRRWQQASKPENRKKLAELADAHRKIAKIGP